MPVALILLAFAALLLGAFGAWQHSRRMNLEREQHIRSFVFPSTVLQQFQETYPTAELKGAHLAARALRQFFLVHLRARGRLIAMPSKAADELWHAFILDTKAYAAFCKAAFGAYLHHIPEQDMAARDKDRSASWRTWRLACLEENINPHKATRLPLLYALDVKLGVEGAVAYDPASFTPPTKSDGCGGGGCGGGCGGSH